VVPIFKRSAPSVFRVNMRKMICGQVIWEGCRESMREHTGVVTHQIPGRRAGDTAMFGPLLSLARFLCAINITCSLIHSYHPR
jgi:hypothetical protein